MGAHLEYDVALGIFVCFGRYFDILSTTYILSSFCTSSGIHGAAIPTDCDSHGDCPNNHYCIPSGRTYLDDKCVHASRLSGAEKAILDFNGVGFFTRSYNHNHLYVYQATKAIGFNIGGVNFNPGEAAESTVEFFAGLFGRRRR